MRLQIQKRKEDSFKVSLGSAVVPQPGKELVVGMVLLFDLDRGSVSLFIFFSGCFGSCETRMC